MSSQPKTMPDGRPDRRNLKEATTRIGHVQYFLVTVPKNELQEVRIAAKETRTRGSEKEQYFIDFRIWQYRMSRKYEEPMPTRRGVQIHRHHMGRVVLAVLTELRRGEISNERIDELQAQLNRLDQRL